MKTKEIKFLTEEDRYYIYIYYDPSRNNEPIYVGKGCNVRAWSHKYRNDNHPFVNRLQLMKRNNVKPVIGLYAGIDNEFADFLETELIAKIGRKDLGLGPLLNKKDGGEGGPLAAETKAKIGAAAKGKKLPPRKKESIEKFLKTRKESPWQLTEDGKARIRIANTGENSSRWGTKHSEETLEKMRAAKRGKPCSEETKQRIRESLAKTRSAKAISKVIEAPKDE